MMRKATWCALLCGWLSLTACQQSGMLPAATGAVLIEHERGACFGPCPIFLLQWHDNGSASLNVQKGFPEDRDGKLSPGNYFRPASKSNQTAMAEILSLAEEMSFDTLGGRYDNPMIMDLPTIRTVVNGVEVVDRYKGPDLALLYDALSGWILSGNWEKEKDTNN